MNKQVPTRTAVIAIVLAVAVAVAVALLLRPDDPREEVTLDVIVAAVEAGEAEDLTVFESGRIEATVDGQEVASPVPVIALREIVDRFLDSDVAVEVEPSGVSLFDRLLPIIPALLIVSLLAVFLLGNRSGGFSSRFAVAERPDVRLADVIGADEAVGEARHLTDWLADPDAYTGLGARPATGILLVGPPGVGKTMMARAVAGETGVPLIAVSGADFVEVFAGLGARRVKSLFKAAGKEAQAHGACVVFIDELDAVGRKRGAQLSGLGGQQEAEQTLNALLVALDGFTVRDRVIVLAATNRPDVLDDALTRPGRFDRTISLTPPDLAARRDLIRLSLDKLPAVDAAVDVDAHARRLAGASGADVANLVNTAAVIAAQQRASTITDAHLAQAWDRLMIGDARPSAVIHPEDRRVTAVHEAGHAVVGLLLPDAPDPTKVTIIPHGGGVGGATITGGTDRTLTTRAAADAQLAVLMAGRAAEQLVLGEDRTTNGAVSDIRVATGLARRMVTEWGWGPLGTVNLEGLMADGPAADRVASAVARMLDDATDRARAVLAEDRDLLDRVVAGLEAGETLDGDDLAALVAGEEAAA